MQEESKMSQETVVRRLKEQGYRITRQRMLIIATILEQDCACCKEIYYKALEKDGSIGIATVYRVLKALETSGLIDRRNLYRIEENRQS